MSEAKKGELAIRDKAILHQQRRLKQATQFTHKDSADLLPLDGLKRLGTSKDLKPYKLVYSGGTPCNNLNNVLPHLSCDTVLLACPEYNSAQEPVILRSSHSQQRHHSSHVVLQSKGSREHEKGKIHRSNAERWRRMYGRV
ncbi:hypothetical protein FQN60_005873 [Etheostoma spectabile]|uniref:Uncharacterized protein n=1 Tax=Etheostoma spectabile TaxID=54343 RepID=A0A5J5CFE4_9PERO|nr:hypothetical protein FQN60_005873 [Etheostoma spectabile]